MKFFYLRTPSGGGVICFNVFFVFVALFCSALCMSLEKQNSYRYTTFQMRREKKQSNEKIGAGSTYSSSSTVLIVIKS
jgi:archaellum component FlaF (FlaF/FlaG flagellin family)